MGELLATALALALAGIDPAGALLAVAALARGTSARTVVAFAAIVVLGTAALGTTLSLVAGPWLADVEWLRLIPGGDLGAVLELAIALALLAWAGARLRRPDTRPRRTPKERRRGGAGFLLLGALFALSAVTDPTFVGLVIVAGRDEPAAGVALAHLLWVLVSQLPLVAVATACAFGAHTRLVTRFERLWARAAPTVRVLLTAVLVLVGLFLAADALSQLLTGRFLVANDL